MHHSYKSLVLVLGIVTLSVGANSAERLHLVEHGLISSQMPRGPYTAKIHVLDENTNSLREVWAATGGSPVHQVTADNSGRKLILAMGFDSAEKLTVLDMDDLRTANDIDLSHFGYVSQYRLVSSTRGADALEIVSMQETADGKKRVTERFLEGRTTAMSSLDAAGFGELKLSGMAREHGGQDDALPCRFSEEKLPEFSHPFFKHTGSPVPDNIELRNSARPWNLIANEPGYRALISIPDRNGLSDRQLLLYNSQMDSWKSIMVPGPETAVKPMGDWLVGAVADSHPDTDYERGVGYGSVLRGEVVLINPIEDRYLTLSLGAESKVLMVDSNEIVYRVHMKLFRASIETGELTDIELLLEDFKILFVNWAFMAPVQ